MAITSVNSFLNKIKQYPSQNTMIKVEGYKIKEPVKIDFAINTPLLLIENCSFSQNLIFEGIDLEYGVILKNCSDIQHLIFQDCFSSKIDKEKNSRSHIVIDNCTVGSFRINGKLDIQNGLEVINNSQIQELTIENVAFSKGYVKILNSVVDGKIYMSNLRGSMVYFNNSTFNGQVSFSENNIAGLIIGFSKFHDGINVWSGRYSFITLQELSISDIFMQAMVIARKLWISKSVIIGSFEIDVDDVSGKKTGEINYLEIDSTEFNDSFLVKGGANAISRLILDFNKQLSGSINFSKILFANVFLTGVNLNSNIAFNQCRFGKLYLEQLNNYSNISLIDVGPLNEESTLCITNSSVGKMQLVNTNLGMFKYVYVLNSILTNISIGNVIWFVDKSLNQINLAPLNIESTIYFERVNSFVIDELEKSKYFYYSQKREIYRQLKYATEKQGDRITSLKFKSLEMSTYKKELFSQTNIVSRLLSKDRFVLWVGGSNDYGQNWIKPLLLAVFSGFIFHFLIIIGVSNELSYTPNFTMESVLLTWDVYYSNMDSLPQLMNPAHFIKRIYPNSENITTTVYFLDYILKIFLAFFIYQIISAFRKYMK